MLAEISWWVIPLAINIVAYIAAIFIAHKNDNGGVLSGLNYVITLGVAGFVSMVVWIIAAFLK